MKLDDQVKTEPKFMLRIVRRERAGLTMYSLEIGTLKDSELLGVENESPNRTHYDRYDWERTKVFPNESDNFDHAIESMKQVRSNIEEVSYIYEDEMPDC